MSGGTTFDLSSQRGRVRQSFHSEWLDPRWPEMEAWARAGVRGGRGAPVGVVATLGPGTQADVLQETMVKVAESGEGAIMLEPGHYVIDRTIKVPSGVVLRGHFLDQVKLEIKLQGSFHGFHGGGTQGGDVTGILFDHVNHSGLEYLTIVFDESVPRPLSLRHMEPGFQNNPHGREDLFVGSVWLEGCEDCWVEACRIVDSGTTPLSVVKSRHCTFRYTEICGSHNLDGGQGYINVSRSEFCLLAGLWVQDIRHLSIQNAEDEHPCRYNVVIDCHLETDVNFHNCDSGQNLIQDNTILCPSWHWWGPFAVGVKNQHQPPGPRNLLFNNRARRLRFGNFDRTSMAEDPQRVYRMKERWDESTVVDLGPAPSSGTLYPVR